MTGGAWLTPVARAILHRDSFDLMVSPAIADLQVDPGMAAYAAVWTSLAGALADDVAGDLRLVLEDIEMLLTLVLIQACYYAGMLLLLVVDMDARELWSSVVSGPAPMLVLTALLVAAISIVPTVLCFWPSRRSDSVDQGAHEPLPD